MSTTSDNHANLPVFDKLRFTNLASPVTCFLLVQGYLRNYKDTRYLLEIFPTVLVSLIAKFIIVRITIDDFIPIKIIGQGHIGIVRLVQTKHTNKYYALKTVSLSEINEFKEAKYILGGRNFMIVNELNNKIAIDARKHVNTNSNNIDSTSADLMNSKWKSGSNTNNNKFLGNNFLLSLEYAFTDTKFVHCVLEYCHGCDLMGILLRNDILDQRDTCFYIIEICLALDAIHSLGFIYRELKPDNVLIDKRGHIKLGMYYNYN